MVKIQLLYILQAVVQFDFRAYRKSEFRILNSPNKFNVLLKVFAIFFCRFYLLNYNFIYLITVNGTKINEKLLVFFVLWKERKAIYLNCISKERVLYMQYMPNCIKSKSWQVINKKSRTELIFKSCTVSGEQFFHAYKTKNVKGG